MGVAALVAAVAALRAAPRLALAGGVGLLAALQLGVISPAALPLGQPAAAARADAAAWTARVQRSAICNRAGLIAVSSGDEARIDAAAARCPMR